MSVLETRYDIGTSRFRFLAAGKNTIVGATKAKTTEVGVRKVTPLLLLGGIYDRPE